MISVVFAAIGGTYFSAAAPSSAARLRAVPGPSAPPGLPARGRERPAGEQVGQRHGLVAHLRVDPEELRAGSASKQFIERRLDVDARRDRELARRCDDLARRRVSEVLAQGLSQARSFCQRPKEIADHRCSEWGIYDLRSRTSSTRG